MGLDTVELIQATEDYFQIAIADTEAEQISTVQDIADIVCRLLGCQEAAENESRVHGAVEEAVHRELQAVYGPPEPPAANEPLAPLLLAADQQPGKPFLEHLAQQNGWLVPQLHAPAPPESSWLFRFLGRKPVRWPDWTGNTLAELIGWIISLNYAEFYAGRFFNNPYDVLRAVIGIVSEKSGAEVWEIHPQDSLTSDLGMD
ncbi:hypothetical protein [Hymenobacter koreensis]|uniref:Carrier domain-containing protein n=1 Tax=Hymenobacter koreensis TaxID=1084523 RepID=A0ABP8IW47_9BACT